MSSQGMSALVLIKEFVERLTLGRKTAVATNVCNWVVNGMAAFANPIDQSRHSAIGPITDNGELKCSAEIALISG